MEPNLYLILGLTEKASLKDINKAYKKSVLLNHPDLNPGKKDLIQKFTNITLAYEVLSNQTSREKYDRINFIPETYHKKQDYYKNLADLNPNFKYNSSSACQDLKSIEENFSSFFKGKIAGEYASFKMNNKDAYYSFAVEFIDSSLGCSKRITEPGGKIFEFTIPPGIKDQTIIKLKGAGLQGKYGEKSGDAYIEVNIIPHKLFKRIGYDIEAALPIRFDEAIMGTKKLVPTIHGDVLLSIPPGSNTDTRLRIKNKAILNKNNGEYGDHYVNLKITVPSVIDEDLMYFIKRWSERLVTK